MFEIEVNSDKGQIAFFICVALVLISFAGCSAVEAYSKRKSQETVNKSMVERGYVPEYGLNGEIQSWRPSQMSPEKK